MPLYAVSVTSRLQFTDLLTSVILFFVKSILSWVDGAYPLVVSFSLLSLPVRLFFLLIVSSHVGVVQASVNLGCSLGWCLAHSLPALVS